MLTPNGINIDVRGTLVGVVKSWCLWASTNMKRYRFYSIPEASEDWANKFFEDPTKLSKNCPQSLEGYFLETATTLSLKKTAEQHVQNVKLLLGVRHRRPKTIRTRLAQKYRHFVVFLREIFLQWSVAHFVSPSTAEYCRFVKWIQESRSRNRKSGKNRIQRVSDGPAPAV